MASLRQMRKRIISVKSIRQITKAMKMVAAARFRRAEERLKAARPYAKAIHSVLSDIEARVDLSAHPLLAHRPASERTGKRLLLLITSDRGLCGSFNTNVLRRAVRNIASARERGEGETHLLVVGRKGRDFLRRREYTIRADWTDVYRNLSFDTAIQIRDAVVEPYLAGEYDTVDLCYNEFKSAMRQDVVVERLLPVPIEEVSGGARRDADFEYLPDPDRVFSELVPQYFAIQIWASLLESFAAEMGARMTSMEAATKNGSKMIDALTLISNRIRQAVITKELSEIVGGAEALGG